MISGPPCMATVLSPAATIYPLSSSRHKRWHLRTVSLAAMSTMHGHVADGSCCSQHDILQPKPEDIALFRDKPQEAARVFKRLFRTDDPRILGFMYAFPLENPTQRQSQLLWSSGFGVALLEALTDNRWYDSFEDMALDENYGNFCTSHSLQFQLAIRGLLDFMIEKSPVTTQDRLLDQCRQRFPSLWRLIWRHREVIFTPQFDMATRYVLEPVARLLEQCCIMYYNQTSQWSPLESCVGHIALLFLANPEYLGPRSSCHLGIILSNLLQMEGRDALLRERSFLHEVVPSVTGGGKGLLKIIRSNLVRGRPINAEEFRCTLNVMALMLVWGPAVIKPSGEGGYAEILVALSAAAQRYECLGCAGPHTTSDYDAADTPKAFLMVSTALAGNVVDNTTSNGAIDLAGDPYRFGMISMIALLVVAVYKENDGSRKLIVRAMLESYVMISKLGREHYHIDRGNWRRYCYVRRILQVYWLPTLRKVLNTLRSGVPGARTDLSAAERASLQELLELWKDIGLAFNLSEKSREDDAGLTSYVTAEELRQGCYFAECLCYGEKPLHGTRRVCKGCWAVYYCGERCQKKDWKAGHRDICRGRSAIADSDRD